MTSDRSSKQVVLCLTSHQVEEDEDDRGKNILKSFAETHDIIV